LAEIDVVPVCFIQDSIYRNNYLWSDTLKLYHDKSDIAIRKLRAQHYLLSIERNHYIIEKTESLLDLVVIEVPLEKRGRSIRVIERVDTVYTYDTIVVPIQ